MILTPAQVATLKTALFADANMNAARAADDHGAMVNYYNGNSTFTVWKTFLSLTAMGNAFNGTELAGLTTANTSRLSAISDWSPAGINPSLVDRRQMFSDVFGASSVTNVALLALYKRFATRCEALFTTGTGTNATPGQLVFEGNIGPDEIQAALT